MDQSFISQEDEGRQQPSALVVLQQNSAANPATLAQSFQRSPQDYSILDTKYDYDLKNARDIRKCIPSYDKAEPAVKGYFEKVVELSCNTEQQIIDCQKLKKEAEACFLAILVCLSSILYLIYNYSLKRYQQKFKIEMFNCDFEKIRSTTQDLKAIEKAIEGITIKLDTDPTKIVVPSTVQDLSDDSIIKAISLSKSEDELDLKIQNISKQEADLVCEFQKLDIDKSQLESKVEELTRKIKSSQNSKDNNIKNMNSANDQLTVNLNLRKSFEAEANQALEISLEDRIKDKQGRKTQIFKFYDEKMAEIEKKQSQLNTLLLENTTINPSTHYMFVVDNSSSMAGSKMQATQRALNAFVESNKAQISSDRISVIVFEDKAHEHMKNCKFSEFVPLKNCPRGGTNFDKAFELTQEIAILAKSLRPVVIFLTDGDGVMTTTQRILTEISDKHRHQGLLFFSIGIGTNFEVENLKKITKWANNGSTFIDIGNDRIELLQTIKDENLLEKIFLQISTSLSLYSIKIKANMDMLDAEKIKLTKEVKEKKEFYDSISEEEHNNIEKKYSELRDRKLQALEEYNKDCQEKLAYFQAKEKELETAIDSWEDEIGNYNVKISELKKDITKIKGQRDTKIQERGLLEEEKTQLMDGRKNSCLKLVAQQQTMGFTSLGQATEYFASFERLRDSVVSRSIVLHQLKSFVRFIIGEASQIEAKLKSIQCDIENLNGYEILSSIYKSFEGIEFEKDNDYLNMKKIAYYLLEIKESDTERKKKVEELFLALHPSMMFDPDIKEEDRLKKIELKAKALCKRQKEIIEEDIKNRESQKTQLEENRFLDGNQKKRKEDELQVKTDKVRELTRKIRSLERSKNEDDEEELVDLRAQLETLTGEKNKLEEELTQLKAKIKYQNERADTIELEIMQGKRKVRELTNEGDQIYQDLQADYIRLKAELRPKVMRGIDDNRVQELRIFYMGIRDGLLDNLNVFAEKNGQCSMRREAPVLCEIVNHA